MAAKKISKAVKLKYLQTAKELKKHLESKEYRLSPSHRAFLQWYVLARFGKKTGDHDVAIVDAAGEGGIDVIVYAEKEIFVLQMKYESVPRISYVSSKDVTNFEKLSRMFQDQDPEIKFETWLKKVRPQLQSRYKKIYNSLKKNKNSVRFVFVTSKLSSLEKSDFIEIEAAQHILSLWDLYRDGFTPPTESIQIKLSDDWSTGTDNGDFRTYVGLADVHEFIAIMADDKNERLFAQNVRTDLRSTINTSIRETYEKTPNKFWLGNNGVYIVCKRVVQEGKTFTLHYPSVINGSQTLHSIGASNKKHVCQILVRILRMDVTGDQRLLGEIIRRTNTQNPMKLINLAAHDPYQLNIARYLDLYKIFYERREKEWKNEKKDILTDHIVINIKDLGQWLSTLYPHIGFGRARSNVSELFQNKFYEEIFQQFDRELSSPLYSRLVTMVWSALFFLSIAREFSTNQRTRARMAQLVLIKLIHDSVVINKKTQDTADRMLEQHRFGYRKVPKAFVYLIKDILSDLINMQKKVQRQDENIDFSNYYKRDDLTRSAYLSVKRKYLNKLSRLLFSNLNNIN